MKTEQHPFKKLNRLLKTIYKETFAVKVFWLCNQKYLSYIFKYVPIVKLCLGIRVMLHF